MLKNVTKLVNIGQLLMFTCFNVNVSCDCIGEKAYA